MSISVQIPNLQKVIELYKAYPENSRIRLTQAIHQSATIVQRNARILAPVAVSGLLRSSIGIKYGDLQAVVMPTSNYAIDVEEGTKPHMVSVHALQAWADFKGVPVYVIQRAIAKYGTKAQPFMEQSATASEGDVKQFFKDAVDDILNTLKT